MIPKKHSSIYNEVSEELNLEVLLIEQLVEFYYKKIRFLLSELEEPRINIESLGHFTIKEKKVYKVIPHYKKLIDDEFQNLRARILNYEEKYNILYF